MPPRRFRRLDRARVLGRELPVARGFATRLLGLALLSAEAAGEGLLIPRCSSVHTFGMRFRLDLVFVDRRGAPLRVMRDVGPCRFVAYPGAAAVLELPGAYTGSGAG